MKEVSYKGVLFRLDVRDNIWGTKLTLVSAESKLVESKGKFSSLGFFTLRRNENKDS